MGFLLNDAESQQVFWVDLPDLASSVENIQIQRGAGTSSNGSGAFGATISLQTVNPEIEPFAEIVTSMGSFNTMKNMVSAGTRNAGRKIWSDRCAIQILRVTDILKEQVPITDRHISAVYSGQGIQC